MVAVRQVALVSDESALEACLQRCAIQIDDLYLLPLPQTDKPVDYWLLCLFVITQRITIIQHVQMSSLQWTNRPVP